MQSLLIGLRKEHGLSQRQAAKLLNISEEAYRNKELGKSEFKMNEMFDISRYYNKPVDKIFLPRKYTVRVQNAAEH